MGRSQTQLKGYGVDSWLPNAQVAIHFAVLESEIDDIDFVPKGIANPNVQESYRTFVNSKIQDNLVS